VLELVFLLHAANKIIQGTTLCDGRIRFRCSDIYAALELRRKRELASVAWTCILLIVVTAYHGLFQLFVSIGCSSRRTIDDDRDNDDDDSAWEAYNIMYKGMTPLSLSLPLFLWIEKACEPARKYRFVSIASYLLTIKTWLYDAVTGDLDHPREQVALAKVYFASLTRENR